MGGGGEVTGTYTGHTEDLSCQGSGGGYDEGSPHGVDSEVLAEGVVCKSEILGGICFFFSKPVFHKGFGFGTY